MRILYATDHRCIICRGDVYLSQKIYMILKRYSDTFGAIILYTRVIETEDVPSSYIFADFITEVVVASSLINAIVTKNQRLVEKIKNVELVVARVPSIVAQEAALIAGKFNIPYLTEVMGVAWDAMWNHGIMGKIIAPYFEYTTRRIIRDADYAIYVTENFLQSRYTCKMPSISASNVSLRSVDVDALIKRNEKIQSMNKSMISIMTTAAVNVRYKGYQYVIKALKTLKKRGIKVKYFAVGQGNQKYLRRIAKSYNVLEQVVFTGGITQTEVFDLLDQVDIYVQPSLQEGLPRAMIEAMSRACPCIGARTAGIPELIAYECVFQPKSTLAVVDAVERVLNMDMLSLATNNYKKSMQYQSEILDKRRNEYFAYIKKNIQFREEKIN